MNTFRMISRVLVMAVVVCVANVNAMEAVAGMKDLAKQVAENSGVQSVVAVVTTAGVVKLVSYEAKAISEDGVEAHDLAIGLVLGGAVAAYTGNWKVGAFATGATMGTIKLVSVTKNTELSKSVQQKLGNIAQSPLAQVGSLAAMSALGAVAVNRYQVK